MINILIFLFQFFSDNVFLKIYLDPSNSCRLNQIEQCDLVAQKDGGPGGVTSMMESVLSLDDGLWPHPADMSTPPLITEVREDPFTLVKQPSPPPVLAKVQQEYATIPPSKVADPRPGVAKQSQDGPEFQHLHIVGLLSL